MGMISLFIVIQSFIVEYMFSCHSALFTTVYRKHNLAGWSHLRWAKGRCWWFITRVNCLPLVRNALTMVPRWREERSVMAVLGAHGMVLASVSLLVGITFHPHNSYYVMVTNIASLYLHKEKLPVQFFKETLLIVFHVLQETLRTILGWTVYPSMT